jgi:sulfur relay (sulfurtransferase) complex TusBCD TusD component (DsrE family)
MKIGIILETKEYEKAWNAFRFGITALKHEYEVKMFLMGEAVECESLTHERYDVGDKLKDFVFHGGEIFACGTCLKSRQLCETETCPISTMNDCVSLVAWADKMVTF